MARFLKWFVDFISDFGQSIYENIVLGIVIYSENIENKNNYRENIVSSDDSDDENQPFQYSSEMGKRIVFSEMQNVISVLSKKITSLLILSGYDENDTNIQIVTINIIKQLMECNQNELRSKLQRLGKLARNAEIYRHEKKYNNPNIAKTNIELDTIRQGFDAWKTSIMPTYDVEGMVKDVARASLHNKNLMQTTSIAKVFTQNEKEVVHLTTTQNRINDAEEEARIKYDEDKTQRRVDQLLGTEKKMMPTKVKEKSPKVYTSSSLLRECMT